MKLLSWAEGFLSMIERDFSGSPAASASSTSPVHSALQQVAQSGEQAVNAVATAAKDTVDNYLTSKIGAVGAEVADTAIQALIAEAQSRLSDSPDAGAKAA